MGAETLILEDASETNVRGKYIRLKEAMEISRDK
jgi:hypothetical protein